VIEDIVRLPGPVFWILKLRLVADATLPKRVWLAVLGTFEPSAMGEELPLTWISGKVATALMVMLQVAAVLTPEFLSVAVTLMV
jgi:hypothetical protein